MSVIVGGVVGAAIGFVVGGPVGALYGFGIGAGAAGLLGPKAKGNGPGDLSAPGLTLGSQVPRVYGTYRLPCLPIWVSDWRATEHAAEGGKGLPSGPSTFTYSADVLYVLADGTNVVAITRLWVNKKLVWSAHASSSVASVLASASTDWFDSLQLYSGGATQVPPDTYENALGAGLVPANRGMCTLLIRNLQAGQSKTLPTVEAEVITAGPSSQVRILTLLQSRFLSGNANDESAYAWGAPTITATGVSIGSGVATITKPDANSHNIIYNPSGLHPNGIDAITFEAIVRLDGPANVPMMALQISTGVLNGFHLFSWPVTGPPTYIGYRSPGGLGLDGRTTGTVGVGAYAHVAMVFTATQFRVYAGPAGGASELIYSLFGADYRIPSSSTFAITLGDYSSAGADGVSFQGFRIRQEEVYTGSTFTAPTVIPAPDVGYTIWTPSPVKLDTIVAAEWARMPGLTSGDVDVTDLATTDVIGYANAGSAQQVLADLKDIFFLDVVPGRPIKWLRRGRASVATIPFADTGIGAENAGTPFAGVLDANPDEQPAVVGIRYPAQSRDGEPGFQRGDALTTQGTDVTIVDTRVVLTDAQAKGRAIAGQLLARARRRTASFGLSNVYAALEPGDSALVTDNDGNQVLLRIPRLNYADGARAIEWEVDEPSALVATGTTDVSDAPSFTVTTSPLTGLLLLDIPLLRDADDSAGIYAALTALGSEWPGAYLFIGNDSSTPTRLAEVSRSAVTGVCAAALANWTGGWVWDEGSSITVTLDNPAHTLASSTRAAMLADETINVAAIGVHGRWEMLRFRNASLVSAGVYLLSGLLRGIEGTEWAQSLHAAGDRFCLLNNSGLVRVSHDASEIGLTRWYRAVTRTRSTGSATPQSLIDAGVSVTPLSVVNMRRVLSGGGATVTWERRSRLSTPAYAAPPLSDAPEGYVATLRNGSTVVETQTLAARTATFASITAGWTVGVRQTSPAGVIAPETRITL